MQRRRFLGSSLAASAYGMATPAGSFARAQSAAQAPSASPLAGREYYELRCYHLKSGPQVQLTNRYVADALIPALNRLGIGPVGAFNLDLGPETPSLYLLLPSASLETLTTAELSLTRDEEYMKHGAPFLNAPAQQPAYERIESSLMIAFEGHPKLEVTPVTAQRGKRVFQLRIYEGPTSQDHRRKVEMFHSGEFEIFKHAGFWPVFYADTLIGPRLPNLTYMVSFPDMAEMNAKWDAFRSDPQWKQLAASPRFSFEQIVSNISSLILNPASYSQI